MESQLKHIARIALLLAGILTSGFAFAQSIPPLTNEAIKAFNMRNYVQAENKIAEALAHPEESKNPYTHYTAGFIHKEMYKQLEPENRESKHRVLGIRYLKECLEMENSGNTADMAISALKFLATSYYNDALRRTIEINSASANEPEVLYAQFRSTMMIADAQFDFTTYDIQFSKAMGQAHYKLWENDPSLQAEAEACADYYERVLILDENDCEAKFNLVILRYNQGVYRIRSMNTNTDIAEMITMQESAIRYFHKAMPLAQACFEQCPPAVNYYKGLMFCHRALGNETEYERLRLELEEKIAAGMIKPQK
jgi:hypothetical protein